MDQFQLQKYQKMHLATHDEVDSIVGILEQNGFARSESMDITNDPRFFSGNVLDKRMAAFSGLATVASLAVGSALDQCYGMKKHIDLSTPDGVFQLVGFVLMNIVLFANVLATYVSVAQLYFTYRLMTAGPTGFEMASSFYLNPNIAFWRHAAVKNMLLSLPVFLFASAFRFLVKFDQEMPNVTTSTKPPEELPMWEARVLGVSLLGLTIGIGWLCMAALLYYVHCVHRDVFQDRYTVAKEMERPLLTQFQRSVRGRGYPDV